MKQSAEEINTQLSAEVYPPPWLLAETKERWIVYRHVFWSERIVNMTTRFYFNFHCYDLIIFYTTLLVSLIKMIIDKQGVKYLVGVKGAQTFAPDHHIHMFLLNIPI